MMKLYHRTTQPDVIRTEGFTNGNCGWPEAKGVRLSARPSGHTDLKGGYSVVTIDIPEVVVEPYTWRKVVGSLAKKKGPWRFGPDVKVNWNASGYRAFCIPSEILNQYGPAEIVDKRTYDEDQWLA